MSARWCSRMDGGSPKRPRVLLLAEAANPEWFSVPLVGWSHSQAIARRVDAHLVTQVRNRDAILRAGLVEREQFTAIDSEAVASRLCRLGAMLGGAAGRGWTTIMALQAGAYYYHEHLVWRRFGEEIRRGRWDLVHRLTPLSPVIPSTLAARCCQAGVPFVLGPLNGGVPWPRQFSSARRKEGEWLSYVRDAHRLLPAYRSTLRDATAILVASRTTWSQIPGRYHAKCVYVPENAIDPMRFPAARNREASRPIQVVFVGRLVPCKGLDMLLDAAAPLVRRGDVNVNIVGDGPLMGELKAQASHERMGRGLRFSGWVDQSKLPGILAESDVFAFPSIRDFGGGGVLEAMAMGVVPLVVDYGGPAELVSPGAGYAIPIGPREQIVERMRSVLSDLAAHPEKIAHKAGPAMKRAHEQFSWSRKAAQVVEVYDWILGRRAEKPVYPMPPFEWPAGSVHATEQELEAVRA